MHPKPETLHVHREHAGEQAGTRASSKQALNRVVWRGGGGGATGGHVRGIQIIREKKELSRRAHPLTVVRQQTPVVATNLVVFGEAT